MDEIPEITSTITYGNSRSNYLLTFWIYNYVSPQNIAIKTIYIYIFSYYFLNTQLFKHNVHNGLNVLCNIINRTTHNASYKLLLGTVAV